MSDTAIFVLLLTKDLGSNGHLPGDTRHLRQHLSNDERVVHLETVLEAPLGDKPSSLLLNSGSILSILPTGSDVEASLVGGFMARLHEFICAYPNVSKFVLAAAEVDRLAAPAQFLQKAGYVVTILGPDRSRLDAVRYACDDVELWSGRGNSSRNDREPRESRDSRDSREDKSSQLDPYDVLVEEVSKGRNKGQRVLLTSLKQRMRRRLRRFDETRLKDLDGKPMKKFKDFIEDAVNRGLIQLVERGNRSQVLLPGEEIPPEEEDSNGNDEETDDDDDDNTGDPLLDTVDSPEESEDRPLTEKDFDVGSINEDADAPSKEFVVFLENTLPESGLTLPDMLKSLADAQEKDALQLNNRELKTQLQNAFYNELLEPVDKESPTRYIVVDDWKDIIEFL
jgi:hypothetical protein